MFNEITNTMFILIPQGGGDAYTLSYCACWYFAHKTV